MSPRPRAENDELLGAHELHEALRRRLDEGGELTRTGYSRTTDGLYILFETETASGDLVQGMVRVDALGLEADLVERIKAAARVAMPQAVAMIWYKGSATRRKLVPAVPARLAPPHRPHLQRLPGSRARRRGRRASRRATRAGPARDRPRPRSDDLHRRADHVAPLGAR